MRRFVTFLICVALGVAALAAPAAAAPPSVIGLNQLRTLLAAAPGGIDGYFLTVAGGPTLAQQTPVPVAMKVLAVADRTGPDGALIMFRADMTDPVMKSVGGIAAGMSGSPLFIDDGGTPKMIGALSYGYSFTVDGLGLATPIEYMMATQNEFPPVTNATSASTLTLERAVTVAGKTLRHVRISTKPGGAEPADTVTVAPLFRLQVTGAPKGSAVYQRFAKVAAAKGVKVMPGGNGQCTQAGFAAPYEQGGSLGAYYTMGSAEVGGYGTVTYVDGNSVMAFGHPMDWVGQTDIFATNAWVSGIWGSLADPFKVACAGQRQGSLTQDRSAAVGVDLGATTRLSPATADVRITTNTTRTGTAATDIAQGTFTAGYGTAATELAVTEPVYRVANQVAMAGSARTTSVVSVTDGASSFTVTRPNVWSGADVLGVTGWDAADMVSVLTSIPGVNARITSVHLDADVDQVTRSATITAVSGGPLQVGANTVDVTIKPVGKPAVTVPVSFTVPSGLVLDAGLAVEAGSQFGGGSTPEDGSDGTQGVAPESLSAAVAAINAVPGNNDIVVSLLDNAGNPVQVGKTATDYYLDGAVYPATVSGQLVADMPQVQIGEPVTLLAMPTGVANGSPITLSQRVAGGSWQTVGTAPVTTTPDGITAATFSVTPTANTTYRATWPGDAADLAWSATADVGVVPPLAVEGARRGKAWSVSVSSVPEAAGLPVAVQVKRNGVWAPVADAVLTAEGIATVTWRTGPATVKVRAVSAGNASFTSATTSPVTLSAATLVMNPQATPKRGGNVTVGLRNARGKAITGVRYRVQRQTDNGWEPAANGTLRKSTRLWLANGDYRVTVPQQRGVSAQVRDRLSVSAAAVVITKARGGRGRASVTALPPIPLRFTVQKLQAGQWLPVGGVRRIAPPTMRWSRELRPGRYRFAFVKQHGFAAAISDPVRVR